MFALHAPFPAIIHDSAGTKAIDRAIIEAGTPGFALMMRAAHAALDRLNALAQAPRAATCVVVLAGLGKCASQH